MRGSCSPSYEHPRFSGSGGGGRAQCSYLNIVVMPIESLSQNQCLSGALMILEPVYNCLHILLNTSFLLPWALIEVCELLFT